MDPCGFRLLRQAIRIDPTTWEFFASSRGQFWKSVKGTQRRDRGRLGVHGWERESLVFLQCTMGGRRAWWSIEEDETSCDWLRRNPWGEFINDYFDIGFPMAIYFWELLIIIPPWGPSLRRCNFLSEREKLQNDPLPWWMKGLKTGNWNSTPRDTSFTAFFNFEEKDPCVKIFANLFRMINRVSFFIA